MTKLDAEHDDQARSLNAPRPPLGTWRLLVHPPASGAWNMAVDEALGGAVAEGMAPPTLRLYAWDPPCVSLGRHQALASIDLERCAALGYDVVRRPTGGRAILHTDELTYSLVAPHEHPIVRGTVLEAYLRIAEALVAGLELLGVKAEYAPAANRSGANASAACFEIPSAYEIVAGGRKLLGSAQTRRAGFVLQHGSLPLHGDLGRLIECLVCAGPQQSSALRRSLLGHAVSLEQVAGRQVSFAEAATALARGVAAGFHANLAPGDLSHHELPLAEKFLREQYGHQDWTARL